MVFWARFLLFQYLWMYSFSRVKYDWVILVSKKPLDTRNFRNFSKKFVIPLVFHSKFPRDRACKNFRERIWGSFRRRVSSFSSVKKIWTIGRNLWKSAIFSEYPDLLVPQSGKKIFLKSCRIGVIWKIVMIWWKLGENVGGSEIGRERAVNFLGLLLEFDGILIISLSAWWDVWSIWMGLWGRTWCPTEGHSETCSEWLRSPVKRDL